ncbi:MAG: FGGY-family carbohydrate kinase [Dehalococcoidales bacterium]|jgi:autoinducer 2 (AI-2) kinase|nr:FGGY-family carbohydrate kinase [Dehalococcoidales bacterium]
MRDRLLLVIDAGSTKIKCLVFDAAGRLRSCSLKDYVYQNRTDNSSLIREFDCALLWKNICEGIQSALYSADIRAEEIAGISATSQRGGVVFLDKAGKELYAGPNTDLRAVTEGLALDARYSRRIHNVTGHLPSLMFAPARLLWFKNNNPGLFAKIHTVLTISDWIIFRLTGNRCGEICSAVETGLADVRDRRVSEDIMTITGLPSNLYPEIRPAGSLVGKIQQSVAEGLGLPEGIPVIQGAPDTICGLLGLGLSENGQTGIISGWSTPVDMITEKPVFDPECRIWTGCHLFEGKWILESNCGETGNSINWLRELYFGDSDKNGFDHLDIMSVKVSPGAEGVMAFVGAEAMDMSRLEIRWGGFIMPVPFSATNIRRNHLARATLENVAFAVKANCQQLEETAGVEMTSIAMGGGLVRFNCLKEILPAVLNRPIQFSKLAETSGSGAAVLAATGAGLCSDLFEAMACMKAGTEIVEPVPILASEYGELYERWLSTFHKLKMIGRDLN